MNIVSLKSTFILSSVSLVPAVADRHSFFNIMHVKLTQATQYPASFRQFNTVEAHLHYTNRPPESEPRS
jgi:hypothetical protein